MDLILYFPQGFILFTSDDMWRDVHTCLFLLAALVGSSFEVHASKGN